MKKIRSLIVLSTISILLLIGGCATVPDVNERESVFSPEPSSAQSIGISEPEELKAEGLRLEDSGSEVDSHGVEPSADGLFKKSDQQSDDMERLD